VAHDAGAIARLSRLLADGAVDARALDERQTEIAGLLSRAPAGLSRSDLLVLAVNLHAYYTVLETLLERVARLIDEELPAGAAWHRDLALQMTLELPALRPPVVPSAALADLDELRRFRHFFRNAYLLDLDPARVTAHAQRVVSIHQGIAHGIVGLFDHVVGVRSALAEH
jgi:hypothetical protein